MLKSFWKPAWTRLLRSGDGDDFAHTSPRRAPYLLVALLLAVLHLGSTWFGYLLISGGAQVTPVFPEAGLDLVVILVFGPRYWPVLFAAYFASNLWRHVPWSPSLGVALASLLRTLIAAWLFRRISAMKKLLGDFVDLVGIGLCALVPTGLAAGLGTFFLILGRRFPAAQWAEVLSRWWIADALGILTITPVLLAVARHSTKSSGREHYRLMRLVLYLGCVSAICYFIFFRPETSGLLFAVFVLILLAAAWLGPTAARFSALAVAAAAIWATHNGVGAFAGGTAREDLQNLDLFLTAISLTGIVVGAFHSAGKLLAPGGVLMAGWLLSGWLYSSLDRDRVTYDEARFDKVITSLQSRIDGRLKTYEDALWGAAGHIASSASIRAKDWDIYVNRLGILKRYPGTVVMAVVQPVADADLRSFVQTQRRERPDFSIHTPAWEAPASQSPPEHFVVVCSNPPAVAARAVGGDLAADPVRRASAERARDTGLAVMTRSASMGGDASKGLQIFVPVYREGAALATTDDRRRALIAWVTLVFRADTFFQSTLGQLQGILELHAFDRPLPATGDQFFTNRKRGASPWPAERITRMSLGGNEWTFGWSRLPGFPYVSRTPSAWAAGCTALLSLLLAGLMMTLLATRRRAADRMRLIQSALAVGTWEIDLESRTVQCSDQLLQLYGLDSSRQSLRLEEWLRSIHPDDRGNIQRDIDASIQNREAIDRQHRSVWPDGSVHWLHSKAVVVADERERPTRVVGVDFDINEIKQLQSQLVQAQKLESVGQLAAGVAHEINTPIQYIGDNGKFLDDAFRDLMQFVDRQDPPAHDGKISAPTALPPPLTPETVDRGVLEYLRDEIPEAITQLLEGVDQVTRIVRAMKEFAHPGPIEKLPIDINRAIESTILVSRNEWKYVTDLTTDFDPELPPVPCVHGEFNQVILNLIVNAAQAIAHQVKGTNLKGLIHITTRQKETAVEIRVSDTGGGIPAAIQSKVFDPFFTTKPVGEGTGQGLAIAHSVIVQKHHGSLTFESEPGRGTTFIIQLPMARDLQAA